MNLLLDTHTFLWSVSERARLPGTVLSTLSDSDNKIFVSAVSFWELSIKVSLGKLKPVGEYDENAVSVAERHGFEVLPLTPIEASTYGRLTEDTHFDPFDRMLIWQAIRCDLILVSRDTEFENFEADGLKLLWK